MNPTVTPTTPPAEAVLPPRAPEAPAPGSPLGSHYDHCFGCGPQHPQGLQLRVTAGEGLDLTAEFTVRPAHQGGPGLAHGGLLVTALDETLGSLNWLLNAPAVTGRIETDFLAPVPVDTLLHLTARITGVHGRKVYSAAEGRLGGPDGPLAVRAQGLFIQVKLEHFTTHGRPEDIKRATDDRDLFERARAFDPSP
ncbi:Thioesterase [Kitasatospora sp. MMS16-BH015]|uniref:PaaI family thioesterase n=1 Tax=Kitasatospora sp. MMS16-BH015 TaxID=2018025 RepID=UPI000CA36B79|nr:PaaI family thioesterase [Kitasatospora sp. MMS16-BH015]AUG80012.1 Thioesterase [Kitasatospora sp. MMS16-BH015]